MPREKAFLSFLYVEKILFLHSDGVVNLCEIAIESGDYRESYLFGVRKVYGVPISFGRFSVMREIKN